MDINYFLSTKEKFEKILSNLNEILDVYYEIQLDNDDTIIENHIKDYEKKIDEVEININQLNKFICLHCEHIFIDDYIDITPDRSERITYCSKCQYTQDG
jgi:hypothetical protein